MKCRTYLIPLFLILLICSLSSNTRANEIRPSSVMSIGPGQHRYIEFAPSYCGSDSLFGRAKCMNQTLEWSVTEGGTIQHAVMYDDEYFNWELNPTALPERSSGYVIYCEKDPELGAFCVFSNVYGSSTVIIDYTLEVDSSCPSQIPGLEPFILVIVFISCIGVVIVSVYKKGIKIKH